VENARVIALKGKKGQRVAGVRQHVRPPKAMGERGTGVPRGKGKDKSIFRRVAGSDDFLRPCR